MALGTLGLNGFGVATRQPRCARSLLFWVVFPVAVGCADGEAAPGGASASPPRVPSVPTVPYDPLARRLSSDVYAQLRGSDTCGAGQYVVAKDGQGGRACAPCPPGSYSSEANASECQPWSDCPRGQYVESEPSSTADRVCADCAVGTHSTHDNSPRCASDGECAPGTQAVDEDDSLGVGCEDCPDGTWNDGAAPGTCREPSTCAPGSWVAEDFEATHDRRCEPCTAGSYSGEPNASACSVCKLGNYCPAGASAPQSCDDETWDDDRDPTSPCADWSRCRSGFREIEAGTSLSDRECEPGVWYHQLGDHGGESLGRAAVDAAGDIYVTGQTAGDIDGQGERGGADVFIRKLSGADGSELWRVQFGSIGDDYVTAVAAGPGGALVVAGSCLADLAANEYREDRRCVQTLSAADGEPLWTHPLPAVGFWTWLDVSASGDIVVSAELGSDVIVRKLSPAGEMLWETLLEGSDGGKGVAFDSAGNVAVSHWRDLRVEYQFFTDGYVTLLSGNSGAELWTTVLDFDAADLPGKVDSDGGDRLVVSADAFDDIGTNSPRLAVLDRSDGAILWSLNTGDRSEVSACFAADGDIFSDDGLRTVQRRAGEDGAELWAIETDFGLMDVASTPSGDVVIVSGDSRLRTELLDGGDGSSQWQDSIQTDRRDVLNSVTIDAFGDVIVGGGTETNFERVAPNGRFDALVRKLSGVAGEPVWTRQFGNDESDEVFALCADSLGDVFVGGDTVADLTAERGQKDAFVSKLSGPSGTTLWSTQFGSEFDDAVEALAIDAEGDTVVTGFTELSRPDRAWVGSAYARKLSGIDGTLLWETRMDEGLSAPGVAVLPDGDIVTAWVSVQDEQQGVLRLSGIDGSVLWSVFLNGNPAFPDFPGYVRDLAVDPTGGIAVLAEKEPVSTLLKLSGEDGSELWEIATEAGPLAFHPDGYWIVANDEEVRRLSNTDGSTLGYTFLSFGEATNRDLAVGATGDVVLAGSTLANVAGTVTYRSTDGFVVKLMPFE